MTQLGWVTLLLLGPVMLCWLLVGYIFFHRAPVLWRHAWGALGALGAGLFLLDQYGYPELRGLAVAVAASGLGWTVAIYAADVGRGIWKVARAEGGISWARLRALARKEKHGGQ